MAGGSPLTIDIEYSMWIFVFKNFILKDIVICKVCSEPNVDRIRIRVANVQARFSAQDASCDNYDKRMRCL